MILSLDAGSTYLKYVLLDKNGEVAEWGCELTPSNFEGRIKDLIKAFPHKYLISTGYGRHMVKKLFPDSEVITEIKAHAYGAYSLDRNVSTVIDIGGQDSKVIRVNGDGSFSDFIMNDRCAAGTGKFLEIVLSRTGINIEDIDEVVKRSEKEVMISSMCAVFAESEVISLLSRGERVEDILSGVLNSIVSRVVGMSKRIGVKDRVVFTGGLAKSKAVGDIISKKLGKEVFTFEMPQLVGAIGGARYLYDRI